MKTRIIILAIKRVFVSCIFSLLLTMNISNIESQEPQATKTAPYNPQIAPASGEGEKAIGNFAVPKGHTVKLFAAEPLLANPVAFSFDHQGRVYVAETFRQNANNGIEDNRYHKEWLNDDLKAQTVEDRIKYVLKHRPEAAVEYTREHDRIRRVVDSNGDGVADSSTVFADGFNKLEEGTGAGVLALGNDVYYTCIPKVWKMTDSNDDGVADDKVVLSDGYGVRYAFRGHDMHGLIRGPDGKIYFSIGDRGFHVMSKEGQLYQYPSTGAVLRCDPNGSNLEVFASGLRNPQELAFDDEGNLFTWDNNSDGGDKARWVFVAPYGETGWRMHFQYLKDRGPWNRERMWWPVRNDPATHALQPAYIVPAIANIGDGPSGICYDPGTGVAPEWKEHFFMADFKGAASNSGIRSIKLEPDGAGYKVVDSQKFLWQILATDVDFGPDGKLYVLDWVHGWNGIGKGRIYSLENSQTKQDPLVQETQQLLNDMPKMSPSTLYSLLGHADRRVRYEAVNRLASLVTKYPEIPQKVKQIAINSKNLLARKHAIWLMARPGIADERAMHTFLEDDDLEIRKHTARILADRKGHYCTPELLLKLLGSENHQAKFYAALALANAYEFKQSQLEPVLKEIVKDNDQDPWLRHSLVMVLAKKGSPEYLAELAKHESAAVRLAAVVALRRLESPLVAAYLQDQDLRVTTEAARAIHDVTNHVMLSALPKLAGLQLKWGATPESDALYRRVISANFRLGQSENIKRLLEFASQTDFSESLREETIRELILLKQGVEFDRVTNDWIPVPERPLAEIKEVLLPYIKIMLSRPETVTPSVIELVAGYKIESSLDQLKQLLQNQQLSEVVRSSALKGMTDLGGLDLPKELPLHLQDTQEQVRVTALSIAADKLPELALKALPEILAKGSISERQNAISMLKKFKQSPEAKEIMQGLLQKLVAGDLAPAIQLEVVEVTAKMQASPLKELYQEYQKKLPQGDPVAKYLVALEGGNVESGQDIFENNSTASCRRCHVINEDGGGVGPDLSIIGKEKSRLYILEAIVAPNKEIAKGFDSVNLLLDSGKVASGIIKEETDKQITLLLPMGELQMIDKEMVIDRTKGLSGMPSDLVEKLSLREIRDLVAYLESLKEKKEKSH